ncbi:MAG: thioredoxin family protein [Candidatus Methanomethylophilus sp.]|nr:thioredoxin family protein [Methanomethylophilus sp.]MDD3233029.1 thioredoxin family protein [Methanomethylophilus sp.]MDD4222285.1 thioredoxin family protein [Methanomethylophilus sp.]MDD4668870.1 thioredoxin family protein [Methanomethylophilus sp.]
MFEKKKHDNDENEDQTAYVKILGTGCPRCKALEANVRTALDTLGIKVGIAHITKVDEIVSYGVMMTPALVFGTDVVAVGRVLKPDEVIELVQKHREEFP